MALNATLRAGHSPIKTEKTNIAAIGPAAAAGALLSVVVVILVYHAWKRGIVEDWFKARPKKKDEGCNHSAILKMDEPRPFLVPSLSNPDFSLAQEYSGRRFERRLSVQPVAMQIEELNPADYIPSIDDDSHTTSPSKYGLGRICFSVFYDKESEQLTFTLIEAAQLPAKNMRGTADPYVKVILLPDKRRKIFSKVHRKTLNPKFNENYTFIFPPNRLKSHAIRLVVYDFDRFSRPTVVGHLVIPLGEIDFKPPRCGADHIWKDITDVIPIEFKRGEVLVSLTYLPNAERLNVVILIAKDLNLPTTVRLDDVRFNIKVTMVTSGRVVKSKHTASIRGQTSPEFNEAFTMDLPNANINHTCVVLTMQYQQGLLAYQKVVGRVVLGPYMYSTGAGLSHWNDMMEAPRSAVIQWHAFI
ncbi:synaptotagmin-1-like [Glandiceps talaboti]